jgi:hypothetical protein
MISGGVALAANEQLPDRASVLVLSTLHNFHEKVPGYGFDTLKKILEDLHPDILAVELTERDLASQRDQSIKQEYQRSVFPFLRAHPVSVITLEPEEPLYSKLAGDLRGAERALRRSSPAKFQALSAFEEDLWFGYLLPKLIKPCDANSRETDSLFEVKHRYQNMMFGPRYKAAWDGWNQYALDKIIAAARSNPGKKIVVLMGAEHGYWLRSRLGQNPYVQVLPNCAFEAQPNRVP